MTLPASDSYDTYGGDLVDYSVVEDPTTDLPASASNALRATAAGLSNTAFRCILTFYVDNSNILHLTSQSAVWDTAATTAPVLSYNGTGWYEIDFPSTVVDVRGNSQPLNLLGGFANPDVPNGNAFFTTVNNQGNNTFYIYNWSSIDGQLEDMGSNYGFVVFLR